MALDIRNVNNMESLITYFSEKLDWDIDRNDFHDIDDVTYDFDAYDLGLREEAFAKIDSLKQLRPLVDNQQWGIFFVEFDSERFEVSALRKILSGLIPTKRNSAEHAVWDKDDLLFLCTWGEHNRVTIGAAHFEDSETGLPQIKMISCEPAIEDFTQINVFEQRLSKLKWPKDAQDIVKWRVDWSSAFTTIYRQTIQDSHTLTVRLAEEAQGIRDRILEILKIETQNGYVHLLFEKFRNTLVHDMTEQQFADMYAQTVVYGLFSARCMVNTRDDFSAIEAVNCIPNTNPFLKSLMRECTGDTGGKLSFDELEIGNIVELLKNTRTDAIMSDFNRQTGGGREDPVIHFYEEFLTEYDKTQKVQRGVYYTPQPVVNFIVRAVDDILKKDFGIAGGLASIKTKKIKVKRRSQRRLNGYYKEVDELINVPAVQVLDPATGTGTFIRQTILQIYHNFCESHNGLSRSELNQAWNKYVPEHLLPRINAFELMMAPYAVAHMKLAMVLKDTEFDFQSDNRIGVYLTNSLEIAGNTDNQVTWFTDPLALESVEANRTKQNKAINVIIGNPPYSTESANNNPWINMLMEDYKKEADGRTKLQERNSKPLNDDYVKFIRYAQNILESQNDGIIAYINPHGFLDGPIYRGMRSSLLKAFNKIYILDLHGNANRNETSPDGSKDENVFDIKQGVCIILLEKNSRVKSQPTKIFRSDIWGTRESKYEILSNKSLDEFDWVQLYPEDPMNDFFFYNKQIKEKYTQGFSLKDLFPLNGVGVMTAHDDFVIDFEEQALVEKFEKFRESTNDDSLYEKFGVKRKLGWDIHEGWLDIHRRENLNNLIQKITYRPFDERYIFYEDKLVWRPVRIIMDNMMFPNSLALVTARSNKSGDCSHFFVSNHLIEYKCGERTTNSIVFPLFTFSDALGAIPNFNSDEIKRIEESLGLVLSDEIDKNKYFSPYHLFCYIYSYLYSMSYRENNKDFLNRDFPIIPYPISKNDFWRMSNYGDKLVNLHLMNFNSSYSNFFGNDKRITQIDYKDGRVYINKTSYFDDVPKNVYSFIVGGYQPCQRWLRERKGRILKDEDIQHYEKVLVAIRKTLNVMSKIDE